MFGKEYGTPATRLLFERTLRRPGGLVGTLTNTFLQKKIEMVIAVPPVHQG
jgi:hypothetical protein